MRHPLRLPLGRQCRRRDSGTVLIVTMWVVLALAGLVLVLAQSMRVEALASANRAAVARAEAAAQGALEFARAVIADANGDVQAIEEAGCEGRRVGASYFWLLRPSLDDDRQHYFGIRDEAARINLNTATTDMLLKLPGMTSDLAASIVDWRDADADVSPGGAESEYYLLLNEPYYCKDAPLEAVEEVLLVRGATAQMLYGEDTNRNGVLDPNENDGDESEPPDNRNGKLDGGFLQYVTVHSIEPNVAADGSERVNVNDQDTEALQQVLSEVIPGDRIFIVLQGIRRGRPYQNTLDFYFRSGLTMEEFAQVADRLTTVEEEQISGLVNLVSAPREVLLCLPELEEGDVDALIRRRGDTDTDLTTIAWVADVLTEAKAVAIGSYITARSYQFAVDIVAVSGDGRAHRRYRAVLDAWESPARVLRWQGLSHLGWPLAPELLSRLRSGDDEQMLTSAMGAP